MKYQLENCSYNTNSFGSVSKSLLFIILLAISITAENSETEFTYSSPLHLKTSKSQSKAASILRVETQKYVMDQEIPWKKYNYDTEQHCLD